MKVVLILTCVTLLYILCGIVITVFYYLGNKVEDKNYNFDPEFDTEEYICVAIFWPLVFIIAVFVFIPKKLFEMIFTSIFTTLNNSYKEEDDEKETS